MTVGMFKLNEPVAAEEYVFVPVVCPVNRRVRRGRRLLRNSGDRRRGQPPHGRNGTKRRFSAGIKPKSPCRGCPRTGPAHGVSNS
jgi:hypothetical protein